MVEIGFFVMCGDKKRHQFAGQFFLRWCFLLLLAGGLTSNLFCVSCAWVSQLWGAAAAGREPSGQKVDQ